MVLITNLPSGVKSIASMSSPPSVRPTSEPSKNHSKLPAVSLPVDVGTNLTISESSTMPKPGIATEDESKLIKMLPSDSKAKAFTSVLNPTSEPSKYIAQVPVPVS